MSSLAPSRQCPGLAQLGTEHRVLPGAQHLHPELCQLGLRPSTCGLCRGKQRSCLGGSRAEGKRGATREPGHRQVAALSPQSVYPGSEPQPVLRPRGVKADEGRERIWPHGLTLGEWHRGGFSTGCGGPWSWIPAWVGRKGPVSEEPQQYQDPCVPSRPQMTSSRAARPLSETDNCTQR